MSIKIGKQISWAKGSEFARRNKTGKESEATGRDELQVQRCPLELKKVLPTIIGASLLIQKAVPVRQCLEGGKAVWNRTGKPQRSASFVVRAVSGYVQ